MSRRHKRRKPMAEINVVPYIDVMLVLLIIFMVTAPMLMQGVKVELPKAAAIPVGKQTDDPLIVSIKADGSYYLNLGKDKQNSLSLALVQDKVSKIIRRKPDTTVLVWGDKSVAYGNVVELMAALQSAGAPAVGLVTENPEPIMYKSLTLPLLATILLHGVFLALILVDMPKSQPMVKRATSEYIRAELVTLEKPKVIPKPKKVMQKKGPTQPNKKLLCKRKKSS